METEVLRLIVQGWTNRRIAEKLKYSEATVKLHVQRILAKLGVKGRKEAAGRAVEIGLMPPTKRDGATGYDPPQERRGAEGPENG
ncbi:MAG: hypothetical protein CYG60_17490 [Actinobacteria bacterium]|nr:LuxR C-terminal-related transcriptional regulator [Actinomycetota bacterium]PLS84529.1 MAG: hypothetical protein CYG60_17490 [Actinomycetota bacterium]